MNDWYKFPESKESVEELRAIADKGDHDAQAKLSLMLLNGIGLEQNIPLACEYLKKASVDIRSVNMCYKTAAQYKNPGAFFGLYLMSSNGWGVRVNNAIATKHLINAAETGFPRAQYVLGLNYKDNIYGVTQDYRASEYWLLKAAANGVTDSYNPLYLLYSKNSPELRNIEEAFKWAVKAANEGYALDQKFLGELYLNGEGVEPDKVTAGKWFYLAACQGQSQRSTGQKQLDQILGDLNEEEKNQVKVDSKKWIEELASSSSQFLGFKRDPFNK